VFFASNVEGDTEAGKVTNMTGKIIRKAFPVALGAAAGYLYWHFIGCSSGHCPLTSHWFTSTLYGALVGATFLLPGRKTSAPKNGLENPGRIEENG
jgi:hypothetical protein